MPILLKFYFRKQTDLGVHQQIFFVKIAQILFKKSFKGIYPFGVNLYHKLLILAPVSPHF